eukprot:3220781-Amphidinium_carterae.1
MTYAQNASEDTATNLALLRHLVPGVWAVALFGNRFDESTKLELGCRWGKRCLSFFREGFQKPS